MNILFFLKPKSEVAYLYTNMEIRTALEEMDEHGFSSIPIIDLKGKYIGTITEGDFLRAIRHSDDVTLREIEKESVMTILRKNDYVPVKADSKIEDLVSHATNQNYVPVVDDDGIFIGIVTRRDIILYCYEKMA